MWHGPSSLAASSSSPLPWLRWRLYSLLLKCRGLLPLNNPTFKHNTLCIFAGNTFNHMLPDYSMSWGSLIKLSLGAVLHLSLQILPHFTLLFLSSHKPHRLRGCKLLGLSVKAFWVKQVTVDVTWMRWISVQNKSFFREQIVLLVTVLSFCSEDTLLVSLQAQALLFVRPCFPHWPLLL